MFICNALCLGMSYVIFQSHQLDTEMDLIQFLSNDLQSSIEEVNLLLIILKYLASEYDDESIVMEQSLRDSFRSYLGNMSTTIISEVLNYWATKLQMHRSGSNIDAFFAGSNQTTLNHFARSILGATNAWRKVDLDIDTIVNLADANAGLMQLMFVEMRSEEQENL